MPLDHGDVSRKRKRVIASAKEKTSAKRSRSSPQERHARSTAGRGVRGNTVKRTVDNEKPPDEDKTNVRPPSPHGYWLMKAEQEDREVQTKNGNTINTKFTIDDLRMKSKPEPWDGVRNIVARNNMRAMKAGDLAFFYASGGKGNTKPAITGIMKIVKEHEVDWTMYDEGAYGYAEPKDRGPDDAPKWSLVNVDFLQKLDHPVTLAEMKSHSGAGQPLADMQLLRNSRVSVSKVSKVEWDFITKKLIEADSGVL